MSAEVFLDSNIILYSASAADMRKREIARKIMDECQFGLSTQVLQECFDAATRKVHFSMTREAARDWLSGLDEAPCVVTDRDLVRAAFAIAIRYRIGYWDAAILAAAHATNAFVVYSEDFNHGQDYGGVRVVNPFV